MPVAYYYIHELPVQTHGLSCQDWIHLRRSGPAGHRGDTVPLSGSRRRARDGGGSGVRDVGPAQLRAAASAEGLHGKEEQERAFWKRAALPGPNLCLKIQSVELWSL